ncbi:MAG: DUF4279 domain-containing protein [Proteobacteria bacterium]|nr:DUF4279 domain-containing protein [Pseudomonadota bacterium]
MSDEVSQLPPKWLDRADMERDCHYTYLKFTSLTRPLEEATSTLGVAPDKGWSCGDARGSDRTRGTFLHSTWALCSGLVRYSSFEAHLQGLWCPAAPTEPNIAKLGPDWKGTLQFVGRFLDRRTPFTIEAGHFRYCAMHGLDLDFDFCFDPMTWGYFEAEERGNGRG